MSKKPRTFLAKKYCCFWTLPFITFFKRVYSLGFLQYRNIFPEGKKEGKKDCG